MAKTIAQIQEQIEKLQLRATALRAKEAAGVIARIKVAIDAYDLKPQDLFGSTNTTKARGKAVEAPTPKLRRKTQSGAAKPSSRPIKYADDVGNTWVGHGKRPTWFVRALESGKQPEDLLVAKGDQPTSP